MFNYAVMQVDDENERVGAYSWRPRAEVSRRVQIGTVQKFVPAGEALPLVRSNGSVEICFATTQQLLNLIDDLTAIAHQWDDVDAEALTAASA